MSGTNGRSGLDARGKVSAMQLLCGTSLSALMLLAIPTAAQAQDANRNWDANGTTVGSGGTGTWNTTNSTWSPNTDGVSGPYGPWDNVQIDNAIFGGTAGTVTLGTPITVHNITFNTANYTLTGNTLTLAGTTPTITVNSGTSSINSIIAGTAGLRKAGAGGLTLGGNNSFTGGVTVDAGTLTLSGANGFTGNVNVNAGLLTLSGTNSFTGTINVNAGELAANTNASLGNSANVINVAGGGILRSTGLLTGRVVNLTSGLDDTVFGRGRCAFYRKRWDQPYFVRQLRRGYRAQRHNQRLYRSGAAHVQQRDWCVLQIGPQCRPVECFGRGRHDRPRGRFGGVRLQLYRQRRQLQPRLANDHRRRIANGRSSQQR